MECPKCKAANADTEQYCRRCHATLLYKCPSCGFSQRHGGVCDHCGVDLAKYALMVVAREQSRAELHHEKVRSQSEFWKQIVLLPITGGMSLIKHFMGRGRV